MEITYKTEKGANQLEKLSSRKSIKSCRKALTVSLRQGRMDNPNTQLLNDNSATNDICFLIDIAAVNSGQPSGDWRSGISSLGEASVRKGLPSYVIDLG